jgi:hypothetical protein
MDTLSKTVAAIDSEQQKQAKLFVALELGQATWVVALHSPIADKISIYRIEGGDTDNLMALIERSGCRLRGSSAGRCRSSPATRRAVTASGCTGS